MSGRIAGPAQMAVLMKDGKPALRIRREHRGIDPWEHKEVEEFFVLDAEAARVLGAGLRRLGIQAEAAE